jgi:predicted transcriptional regulator
MMADTTITMRIQPAIKEKLGRLAKDTGRTSYDLAAEAISAYVEREFEIIEGLRRGLEDVKAGRIVPHEQVVAEAREIIVDAGRSHARASRK